MDNDLVNLWFICWAFGMMVLFFVFMGLFLCCCCETSRERATNLGRWENQAQEAVGRFHGESGLYGAVGASRNDNIWLLDDLTFGDLTEEGTSSRSTSHQDQDANSGWGGRGGERAAQSSGAMQTLKLHYTGMDERFNKQTEWESML